MLQIPENLRSVEAQDEEQKAIGAISRALAEAAVSKVAYLVGPDDTKIQIPEPLFAILRQAAVRLSKGERIVLAPVNQEISTQDAANLLGVSRPYFVKLLDDGAIEHSKTGRYRRVRFGDVINYRDAKNRERRERLGSIISGQRDRGLFDLEEREVREA